jgi:nitrate reductase delta subunit
MMHYEHAQLIFGSAAYLLLYPDEEWRKRLVLCRQQVQHSEHRQIRDHLLQFITYMEEGKEEELLHHYVYTFDFGRSTNLYVTYIRQGETRDRGAELVALKQQYARAGWEMDERELPDYLPLMLEFASCADQQDVQRLLTTYGAEIAAIREQLVQVQSPYTLVLDAVLMAMEEIGIERPVLKATPPQPAGNGMEQAGIGLFGWAGGCPYGRVRGSESG